MPDHIPTFFITRTVFRPCTATSNNARARIRRHRYIGEVGRTYPTYVTNQNYSCVNPNLSINTHLVKLQDLVYWRYGYVTGRMAGLQRWPMTYNSRGVSNTDDQWRNTVSNVSKQQRWRLLKTNQSPHSACNFTTNTNWKSPKTDIYIYYMPLHVQNRPYTT